jgi:hypothetical protein
MAVTPTFALSVHYYSAREGFVMGRYLAFLVVSCAFAAGVVTMVETHIQASNNTPKVVAQNAN